MFADFQTLKKGVEPFELQQSLHLSADGSTVYSHTLFITFLRSHKMEIINNAHSHDHPSSCPKSAVAPTIHQVDLRGEVMCMSADCTLIAVSGESIHWLAVSMKSLLYTLITNAYLRPFHQIIVAYVSLIHADFPFSK